MKRFDIINKYISKYNLNSYLEIGVRNRLDNFDKIDCSNKLCVDPDIRAKADLIMTSDEFFKTKNDMFDIVFIDGLHEAHQVFKDIRNSLNHLNKNGIIVCHDCNPQSAVSACDYEDWYKNEESRRIWNGDCWKGFVKYRFESDYNCFVIDEDCGCGIINTNEKSIVNKKCFSIGELVYDDLDKNRIELLGLVSSDEVF